MCCDIELNGSGGGGETKEEQAKQHLSIFGDLQHNVVVQDVDGVVHRIYG